MKRLCGECGKRAVEPVVAPGRRSPFRNFPALELPATLAIPTCANCGAEWIDRVRRLGKPGEYVVTVEGAHRRAGPWEPVRCQRLQALLGPHPMARSGQGEAKVPAGTAALTE